MIAREYTIKKIFSFCHIQNKKEKNDIFQNLKNERKNNFDIKFLNYINSF